MTAKRPRIDELIEEERRSRRNAILVWAAVAFVIGYLIGYAFGWPY